MGRTTCACFLMTGAVFLLQEFWFDKLIFKTTENVFLNIKVSAVGASCTNQASLHIESTTFSSEIGQFVNTGQDHIDTLDTFTNNSALLCADKFEVVVLKTTIIGRVSFTAELYGCIINAGKY